MDFMGGISTVLSILSFTMFAAGVMKVFQMATTLSEIKDVLTAIKLNTPIRPTVEPAVGPAIGSLFAAPTPLSSGPSGEEMLQAALSELDHPVDPASIEIGNKD